MATRIQCQCDVFSEQIALANAGELIHIAQDERIRICHCAADIWADTQIGNRRVDHFARIFAAHPLAEGIADAHDLKIEHLAIAHQAVHLFVVRIQRGFFDP